LEINFTKYYSILELLKGKELDVQSIEKKLKKTQSETSQQLRKLRSIGIVNTKRVGKSIFYSLDLERKEYFNNLINQF